MSVAALRFTAGFTAEAAYRIVSASPYSGGRSVRARST